jgi:hypothetical protein
MQLIVDLKEQDFGKKRGRFMRPLCFGCLFWNVRLNYSTLLSSPCIEL